MYVTLIDYYTKHNNNSKHDSSVDENELDFFIVLNRKFYKITCNALIRKKLYGIIVSA